MPKVKRRATDPAWLPNPEFVTFQKKAKIFQESCTSRTCCKARYERNGSIIWIIYSSSIQVDNNKTPQIAASEHPEHPADFDLVFLWRPEMSCECDATVPLLHVPVTRWRFHGVQRRERFSRCHAHLEKGPPPDDWRINPFGRKRLGDTWVSASARGQAQTETWKCLTNLLKSFRCLSLAIYQIEQNGLWDANPPCWKRPFVTQRPSE